MDTEHTMNTDTKPQAQHSPLPWHISRLDEDERMIRDVQGADMAVVVGATEANARLIVRAVNHAEKLAEVLREAREVIAEEYGATVASGSPLVHRIDAAIAAYEEAQS